MLRGRALPERKLGHSFDVRPETSKEDTMNKRVSVLALCAGLILLTATGCVVNKAIPQSAIADNLALEKAHNEMIFLNVLRAKEDNPMMVTGISKITGSIKAEATLGATIPLGSFKGGSASNYVASPGITYNWNPSFELNVFDTSEFMQGFLRPVSSDTFAYYWSLGFHPQVLLNLMVSKVSLKKVSGCDGDNKTNVAVTEFILFNNQEWVDDKTPPRRLEQFSRWIGNFVDEDKKEGGGAWLYFVEAREKDLGPQLNETQALEALVKGLKEKLALGETENGKGKFQLKQEVPSKFVLTLKEGDKTLTDLYNWTRDSLLRIPADLKDKSRKGHAEECLAENSATQVASQLMEEKEDKEVKVKYVLTLSLRSPESILYYIGELARIEEKTGKTAFYCLGDKVGGWRRQPLFVVRRSGECGKESAVQATTAKGHSYVIPTKEEEPPPCDGKEPIWDAITCDGGRSMEALTLVSQLIALQKSVKDLPPSSVVRVIGQ